jgi:hypothetical protein
LQPIYVKFVKFTRAAVRYNTQKNQPLRYLIVTGALFYSAAILATDYKVDTIVITSTVLNETRTILIFQSNNFQKTDSVSMHYLLDGELAKQRFDKIVQEQFCRPIIGIGLINTDRNRDMLPVKQPYKFLDFIENELIPGIEKAYNIKQRILFGHSFAGGFTIFSMINKPGLFDKYIASSPTPIMNMVDTLIYTQLDVNLLKNIKFYFSYGSNDMKQVKKWGERLYNNLLDLTLRHIVWRNEVYEGENHNTSDAISLINGLKY